MATNNMALQLVNARGQWMGFASIFRKEHDGWWRTRTWLVHSIIWLVLVNGILLAVLNAPVEAADASQVPSGTMFFVLMGGLMTALGIILVMQGTVLDEKKSGTAAWVLSKPVSRRAFIVAKLTANGLAALLIMIVLQGAVAYVLLSTGGKTPPALPPFLAGLGLMALHLLFYLTLTLMLSTLFNERGVVLGVPLALVFGAQLFMGFAPALAQIMPWSIVLPLSMGSPALANLVMDGQPLPTVVPIIATVLWIVTFVGVALWRFEREEF
jgi:ABC-2 type transport system permease protein